MKPDQLISQRLDSRMLAASAGEEVQARAVPRDGPAAEVAERLEDHLEGLRGKRLLVTGAAGFLGGQLFRLLAGRRLDVTGTVFHAAEAEALRARGHKAEVLDLAGDGPWDRILSGVDIIWNIAAKFQEVEESEDHYAEVNHHGALRLATTAARLGVKRFIHCSTVGVFGDVKEIPATERSPFNPMDAYHRTKLAGEQAILAFARRLPAGEMTVIVNRPAMVYGPGDLRMLKLFQAILSGRFLMIGSGETLAHLGYIEDQTASFTLCATASRERVHCEAFNIASDGPLTLNELARLVAEEGGGKIPRLHVPVGIVWLSALLCEVAWKPFGRRPPLFRRRVGFFTHNRAFDLTKARLALGYRPQWSHRAGIAATIAWYRNAGLL